MSLRIGLDCLEVRVKGHALGQAVINVLHYTPWSTDANIVSGLSNLLVAFQTMWKAMVLPALSDAYSVSEYEAVQILGTEVDPTDPSKFRLKLGDRAVRVPTPGDDVGTQLGAMLPTYAAATIRKLSGKAGRTKRGSCRIGPLIEQDTEATDGNRLTAAGQLRIDTAAQGLKNTLVSSVPADTFIPQIFSKTTMLRAGFVLNDCTTGMEGWIDYATNPYLGSQVSRKAKSTTYR